MRSLLLAARPCRPRRAGRAAGAPARTAHRQAREGTPALR